ncbi:cell surface protein [Methanosarcina barkeri str. Wiesmoor]|uniref:Cell surface protein n=2 Tax=Methanosarcina barkeri TaxID=2208 RepID=A0A0E3QMJ7_METBA|nr:cell surface protein [Methanosarcina barkeri str. Wiesmoor]
MYVKGISNIIFLVILSLYLMTAGSAAANVLSVSNDTGRPAEFTTIQAAVAAANPGDEIVVKPGIYEENIVINKNISIVSESGNFSDTLVQAADVSQDVFLIWANGVRIKGLGISGSNSAGIHVFGFIDCCIESNKLFNNNCGIDLYMMSSGNKLDNNEISNCLTGISLGGSLYNNLSNNLISNCSKGISFFDSSNNFLENNTISQNTEGVFLTGESNSNTIIGNTVILSEKSGLHIYETSNNLIYNNCFNNTVNVDSEIISGKNIWNMTKTEGTNIAGGPYLGGNLWARPDGTIYPEKARDIDLDGIFDSQYNIEGTQFIDYLPLKGFEPAVITVNTTVNNSTGPVADFTSIQAAIDNALPGDTILIFPGVYEENINVYVTNLTLISQSSSSGDTSGDTIIKAASSMDDVFYVTADGVTIRGLNIIGPVDYPNSGIHLNGVKYCNIESNQLSNNYTDSTLNISSGNSSSILGNSGSAEGSGIRLDSSSNNFLDSNTVSGDGISVLLRNSSENTLLNNSVSGSNYGIWVDSSSNNTLEGNILSNNKIGAYLKVSSGNVLNNSKVSGSTNSGINLWDSVGNTLSNSTASKNSVSIVLRNSSSNLLSNNTVSDSNYGLWLYSSSNDNELDDNRALNNQIGIHVKTSSGNVLTGNTALNSTDSGISVWDSAENTLINNEASNNYVSIYLQNSSENAFSNNAVSGSNYGMWIAFCSNNSLSDNNVSNNIFGFYLKNSNDNRLSGNQANSNSRHGIYLGSSMNNILDSNMVTSNSEYGLFLLDSGNSSIYNNYFNNVNNIYLQGSNAGTSLNTTLTPEKNIVDGTYLCGNFWATPNGNGFSQTHEDKNGDGICDAAYTVNTEGIDYLPLADSRITI